MSYGTQTVETKSPPLPIDGAEPHHLKQNRRASHHLRCLVVDDNENVLKFVAYMLAKLGFHEVDTAQKEPELMTKLTTGPYDLLVTDLEMPDMNGFDLTHKIKTDVYDTKVIIMTGRPKNECRKMMDARWVDGWLFKPFGMNELRYKLIDLGLPEL